MQNVHYMALIIYEITAIILLGNISWNVSSMQL